MLQMNFYFFNVESIYGFTSTLVGICSDTSYPFGFLSRIKRPLLYILKILVATLRNQNKQISFVRVDEDGLPSRSYEFMKKYRNMNIIAQTTGGDASLLNGKGEIPIKTLANIKIPIILNSSDMKNFCALLISIPSGSPTKLRIFCVVMFPNYSGMEKDVYTNTSKCGL